MKICVLSDMYYLLSNLKTLYDGEITLDEFKLQNPEYIVVELRKFVFCINSLVNFYRANIDENINSDEVSD